MISIIVSECERKSVLFVLLPSTVSCTPHGAPEHNHAQALLRVPELCETLRPDVLTGMLDAGQQVGDELVDGAFVLDGSRDALSDLDLVALAARMEEEAVLGSLTRQRGQCGYLSNIEFDIQSCNYQTFCVTLFIDCYNVQ